MLDELELQWVPVEHTWRLNERHYGALQGQNKRECSEHFGVEQARPYQPAPSHEPFF